MNIIALLLAVVFGGIAQKTIEIVDVKMKEKKYFDAMSYLGISIMSFSGAIWCLYKVIY